MNDFEYSNLINIAALLIGLQNLYENEQQTAYNDVHASNQKQAEYLLVEIGKKFDEQNKKIDEILERLERIEENGKAKEEI